MIAASSRIPAARAVAKILMSVPGLALSATKARPRISAALVTSRPVRPMPSTTAVPVLENVSHDADTTLGWCDDQFEFEFALDLLLDGPREASDTV